LSRLAGLISTPNRSSFPDPDHCEWIQELGSSRKPFDTNGFPMDTRGMPIALIRRMGFACPLIQ